MEIGLGLPISKPRCLIDWARRAEASGFSTLALLDRLVYANPEPLTALAVLAGATERIRLQTEVLLGPLRSTALLAKQVATLDSMSGGRFTLGIGIGGRADDHAAAGVPLDQRGALLVRLVGQITVAVGSRDTVETARAAGAAYYASTGHPGWGAPISDPHQIDDLVAGYHELGVDELVLYCYADDPDQVDHLATILLSRHH